MRFAAVVGLALLLIPAVAVAGPLEDGRAAYDRKDFQTALKLLQPLADNGNARAQEDLGMMYSEGHGVPRNYGEASHWFQKAAKQGYAMSQFTLGMFYATGLGVPRNYEDADFWLTLASKSGFTPTRVNAVRDDVAGHLTAQQLLNVKQRIAEWRPTPVQPPAPAVTISSQLQDGQAAFKRKDYETARKLLQPLAENGDARAQATIGSMYAFARGVPQDNAEALKWYRMAADQGNSDGESGLGMVYHSLGYLHDTGKNVPQNYMEAYFWLTLATKSMTTESIKGSKDPNVIFISRYWAGAKKHLSSEQIEAVEKRVAERKPTQPPVPAEATGRPETK